MVSDEERLQLRHEESGFCVAVCGHLVVTVWGRDARGLDLEQLSSCQRELIASYGYYQSLSIIRAGLSLYVSQEVRDASQKNLEDFGSLSRGSATTVEAGGVRAAFFRSVVTGLQMLTLKALPQKVFNNIDEALVWLCELSGEDVARLGDPRAMRMDVHAVADAFGAPKNASKAS